MRDRAWRRWQTQRVVKNRKKTAQAIDPRWAQGACCGRWRKKKPFDCGGTRCFVCHSDKLMETPRKSDVAQDLSFSEQLMLQTDGISYLDGSRPA